MTDPVKCLLLLIYYLCYTCPCLLSFRVCRTFIGEPENARTENASTYL